jgi:uncharacterized protein YmfQ (DUF2313 family)
MDLTTDAYAQMLAALMPPGAVWPAADPDSFQGQLLAAWAEELARVDGRAGKLIDEAFPGTVSELLGEWEADFGLPEPCDTRTGLDAAARRARLLLKYTYSADHTADGWHKLAKSYDTTIELYSFYPSYAGRMVAGRPLIGHRGRYFWRVTITSPTVAVTRFTAGRSRAGQHLGTWGRSPLECAIRRRAHAHTIPIFAYIET